jgi:hypothetical protein
MSKGRDRNVYKRGGKWVNKRQSGDRASSLHDTQKEAIAAAREMLNNQGGGEVSIHSRSGPIRRKVTVGDGDDPFPPRDK